MTQHQVFTIALIPDAASQKYTTESVFGQGLERDLLRLDAADSRLEFSIAPGVGRACDLSLAHAQPGRPPFPKSEAWLVTSIVPRLEGIDQDDVQKVVSPIVEPIVTRGRSEAP